MIERPEFSLLEIFGQLPVHPDEFKKLDKQLKYLGNAVEGESWCLECGTLSPRVPRLHHCQCGAYKDADEYEEWVNPLGDCPDCDSNDGLSIDSSREMRVSTISCCDCGYLYSKRLPEESLIERFLAEKSKLKTQEAQP